MFKKFLRYFSITQWIIWIGSLAVVTIGFALTKQRSALSYLSSLFGISCIIFNAKGNVIGQFIAIIFSALYAAYSYTQHYYGEMIIYLALMIPIHSFSIVSWLRNKYNGKACEVKINTLKKTEYLYVGLGAAAITVAFYFLLKALNTDNLIVSTISLTTSITAAYLILRRCEYYSICFIANDIVLIILWSMKIATDGWASLPSVLGFVTFLVIDGYCFISWRKMHKRQTKETNEKSVETEQPDTPPLKTEE